MIPAPDLFDPQVRIYELMLSGAPEDVAAHLPFAARLRVRVANDETMDEFFGNKAGPASGVEDAVVLRDKLFYLLHRFEGREIIVHRRHVGVVVYGPQIIAFLHGG